MKKIFESFSEFLLEKSDYELKEFAIDYFNDKYGTNANIVYHGSPNITYLNTIKDIDTTKNTLNAKSKYLFVNNKSSIALNYAQLVSYTETSGVAVFKMKGKKYTMKNSDTPIAFKSIEHFESFLDGKKEEGFDYVIMPQDGKNIAILNNNILQLKEIYKIINNL